MFGRTQQYFHSLAICLLLLAGWFLHEVRDVRYEREPVTRLRISPRGNLLARASDEPLTVFNLATGAVVASFRPGYLVEFSPDEKLLADARRDGTITVYDISTDAQKTVLATEGYAPEGLAFSPDGQTLATHGELDKAKDQAMVWNISTGELVKAFQAHDDVYDLRFSPCGELLGSVGFDRLLSGTSIRLWDVASWELRKSFSCGKSPRCYNLSFSEDGTRLLSGASIWDVHSGDPVRTLPATKLTVSRLQLGPNDQTVLSMVHGQGETAVSQIEVASGKALWTVRTRLGLVRDFQFDPVTQHLTVAGHDGGVEVWDTRTLKRVRVLRGLTARRVAPHWYVLGGLASVWTGAWVQTRRKAARRTGGAADLRLLSSWWLLTSVVTITVAHGALVAWNFSYLSAPIEPIGLLGLSLLGQLLVVIAVLVVGIAIRVSVLSVLVALMILSGFVWLTIDMLVDILNAI